MANKIYTNHTLEEYNKKYGDKGLKKVNKADTIKNKSLLNGHSWWLIKETYYQLPDNKGFAGWWHNLGKGARTAICIVGGVAIATAVVVPTVIAVKGCANTVSAELVDTQGAKIESSKFDGDYYVIMLKADDATKEVSEITSITIGNQTLIKDTDFTYNPISGKLSINKSVITANKNAKILIKAEVGPTKTRITITADKNVIPVKGTLQFSATVTPSSASSKTVKWGMVHNTNAGSGINEDTGLFNGAVAGTYKIQAHLADDETIKSNIFEVTVKTDVTSIELPATATGDAGADVNLEVTVNPELATVTYDWSIEDKTILNWKTGEEHKTKSVTMSAIKAGKTNVTVKVKDQSGHEKSATCAVTINPTVASYKIDWDTRDLGSSKTLHDLANTSTKLVIGTNQKYKETAEKLGELVTYNVEEGESPTGTIKAYYGKNQNDELELYVLSDKKIAFDDNDRTSGGNQGFFYYLTNLKSIILENIDTSNVTNFGSTFYACAQNLSEIDVSQFNTSKAKNMKNMFHSYFYFAPTIPLTIKGLENFDTSKVTNMDNMFYYCKCSSLDLSSFDTSNVTSMKEMFRGCSDLQTIYASDKFVTTSITETGESLSTDMFKSCTQLVGGQGTSCDGTSHINKEYARIDGGASNPGYFSVKA